MFLKKEIAIIEQKIRESFQRNVKPIYEKVFEAMEAPFEEYLKNHLLPEDQHLTSLKTIHVSFIRSFLSTLEDLDIFITVMKDRTALELEKKNLFSKTLQFFFEKSMYEYLNITDRLEQAQFNLHLTSFVEALDRFETAEVYFSALYNAFQIAVIVDQVMNRDVLVILMAKIDEESGFSVHREEMAEKKFVHMFMKLITKNKSSDFKKE